MIQRTLLIGLDGATFTVIDTLLESDVMPFLKRQIAAGVRAELMSVVPALTPPAWTSLMTGRQPGQHGIFDFLRKEKPDSTRIRFLTSQDLGCETIWSYLSEQGKRATVLNFPLTFPPPRINGFVVPGWMSWRTLQLGCHPTSLYQRMKALPDFNARELATDVALEEKGIEGCHQDEYEDWIALHIRREQQWFEIARMLMRESPCDLTAVLFDGTDKLQHLCWSFLDPSSANANPSSWAAQVRQRCLDYFRQLDQQIAELCELAGPDATVVIASDHGFGPQNTTFFINTWLEQRGYLAWADTSAAAASDEEQMGVGRHGSHIDLIDWSHTRAYVSSPSGNGIHILKASPEHPNGVSEDDYPAFCAQLAEELLAFVDPQTGAPVVTKVWTREQIFSGPYEQLAPDLTLELQSGGFVSMLASDAPVKHREQVMGNHRPEGVFLAWGPELRTGLRAAPLSILDIAPLLLYSLDVPIPSHMDGRLPEEIFAPSALQARPARTAAPTATASPTAEAEPEPVLDDEAEAEVLRRLHALGYLE